MMDLDKAADQFIRDVCELPNRTSPEDWPEAMLITGPELHAMLLDALQAVRDETWRETLLEAIKKVDNLIPGRNYGMGKDDRWTAYVVSRRDAVKDLRAMLANLALSNRFAETMSIDPSEPVVEEIKPEADDLTMALAKTFTVMRDHYWCVWGWSFYEVAITAGLLDRSLKPTPLGRAALALAKVKP